VRLFCLESFTYQAWERTGLDIDEEEAVEEEEEMEEEVEEPEEELVSILRRVYLNDLI